MTGLTFMAAELNGSGCAVYVITWPTCDSAGGGLNRPKCAHRTGIRTCEGFASARVKHYLNDIGPITAANALELFLSLFARQLASTKKVHVMLLMGIQ